MPTSWIQFWCLAVPVTLVGLAIVWEIWPGREGREMGRWVRIGTRRQWTEALCAFTEDENGKAIAPCSKPSIDSFEVMKYCELKALVLSGHWSYDTAPPAWTEGEEARLLDAAEAYFARLHRLEALISIHDEWPEDRSVEFSAKCRAP